VSEWSPASSNASEPFFLVEQMIEEIDKITKRTCAQLLQHDVQNNIGQDVLTNMKSPSELAIVGIALRKRQMRRLARGEEKNIEKQFIKILNHVYSLGYHLHGST
jgi:hypothetical protein